MQAVHLLAVVTIKTNDDVCIRRDDDSLLWLLLAGTSPLLLSAWSSLKIACRYDLIFSSMSLLWQLCATQCPSVSQVFSMYVEAMDVGHDRLWCG